jgi:hypothetical protein
VTPTFTCGHPFSTYSSRPCGHAARITPWGKPTRGRGGATLWGGRLSQPTSSGRAHPSQNHLVGGAIGIAWYTAALGR